MSVLRRAAPELRSSVDDAIEAGTYGQPGYGKWMPGMRWQSRSSTGPGAAVRLSAVFASWRLLSDAIGTLPMAVYTRAGDARVPIPTPAFLAFRGPGQSRISYLTQVVLSLLSDGNAFIAVLRDRLGVPIALFVLDPTKVEVGSTKGVPFYVVDGETYTPFDIVHIAGMVMPGEMRGMSPIRAAREVIDGALQAQSYGTEFFANAGVPPAVITIPAVEEPAERSQARAKRVAETWHETHGGSSNAGKIGVLTGGAKLETVAISPEDAQWLESRRFGVQEVARIYGIPPHLLADSSNSTSWGSGLAEQNLAFGQFALRPWTERIEEAHDRIVASAGMSAAFVKLNLDALLRASLKDRYEAYQIGINSQILVPNEARRWEDLPPLDGGDVVVKQPFVAADRADMSPIELAAALQKIYLAVGKVISAEEAREILNRAGADLTGPAPVGGGE